MSVYKSGDAWLYNFAKKSTLLKVQFVLNPVFHLPVYWIFLKIPKYALQYEWTFPINIFNNYTRCILIPAILLIIHSAYSCNNDQYSSPFIHWEACMLTYSYTWSYWGWRCMQSNALCKMSCRDLVTLKFADFTLFTCNPRSALGWHHARIHSVMLSTDTCMHAPYLLYRSDSPSR